MQEIVPMQEITHSECIYAPGDGELVEELFRTLGFTVIKVEGYPGTLITVKPRALNNSSTSAPSPGA